MGKRQADYTIHNVTHHIPKFIKNTIPEDKLPLFKSNLSYLAMVANSFTYDKLSAKSFINTFTKPFYEYSRQEINQAIAEAIQADVPDIDTESQKLFMENFYNTKMFRPDLEQEQSIVDNYDDNMQKYQRRVDEYYQYINDQYGFMAEEQERYNTALNILENMDVSGVVQDVVDAVKAVIDSKEWLYLGTFDETSEQKPKVLLRGPFTDQGTYTKGSTKELYGHVFLSTQPIICSNIERSKAVQRANFGHYLVCLSKQGDILYSNFVLNSLGSAYRAMHPHLSSSSNICWGTASHVYGRLLSQEKPNYIGVLGIVKSLMETYSPDNPYNRLSAYVDKSVNKRHPILLDEFGTNLIPADFLAEVVGPQAVIDHLEGFITERLQLEYYNSYYGVLGIVKSSYDTLPSTSNIPDGIRHKIFTLLNTVTEKIEHMVESWTPEEVGITADYFTDNEWEVIQGHALGTFSDNARAILSMANFVRYKATGKQSAMHSRLLYTSKGCFVEFTRDTTFDCGRYARAASSENIFTNVIVTACKDMTSLVGDIDSCNTFRTNVFAPTLSDWRANNESNNS